LAIPEEMKFLPDSVYGTLLRSSVVEGFTLTETAYPASLRLPRHSHHSAYFCFVLQGRFTEFYQQQQSRACRPSTLIFHPADETHSDFFSAPARCFNIIMDSNWAERIRRHSAAFDSPTDFHGGFVAQLAMRLYKESRQMDELSPLIIEGLTIEIIGETARHSLKRQKPVPPQWLGQARELLHDQFQECLTLAKVAGSVGVHETHLSREFRRYYRCTVGEYLRRLRVEFACRKLSASATPLSEIALAAGFSDQSHFARTFKRMIGTSPAAYRRAQQRPR
jgi:AraC family transcriptional regulator